MKTRVTERNMATVMGHINTFLRKPTKRYLGKKQVQVGTKEVGDESFRMTVPVYELQDCYVPFIGKCEEHWRRKEIRKKAPEDRFRGDDQVMHTTLLSVSDNYETNCIPIMVGFVVEITGDKMIIKENDVVHHMTGIDGKPTSYKMRDKSEFVYFYHMNYTDEDILERQKHAMFCGYEGFTDSYYCGGSFHDFFENEWKVREAMDTMHEVQELFDELLAKDFGPDDTKLSVDGEINETNVTVFCNPSAYRNGVTEMENNMYVLIDDKKYYDILDVVLHLVADDEDDGIDDRDQYDDWGWD